MLDLANPLSPLSALRSVIEKQDAALQQKLNEILQQGAAKAATAAERARGTAKGADFEDVLEAFIANECRPRHDLCRHTATEIGFDGNQVGDFVIEVDAGAAHGPGLRIVVEAKNAQRGQAALVRELDKAIKNRCAAFGITVVSDPAAVSPTIVPFGDDKLIVRVSPIEGSDSFDMIALAIAIDMARWKSIVGRAAPARHMDLERIQSHVTASLNLLNRFSELKKRLTATKNLDRQGRRLRRRDPYGPRQRIAGAPGRRG